MKIITCAGYHSSGSSAITDFLSEFDNCYSLGTYQFRFIQDPNGISDLEYNLVENNHRLNTSYAIKRYKKLVDLHSGNWFVPCYEKYFDGNFKKVSYEYIDELTEVKFKGTWNQEVLDKGRNFYYIYTVLGKIYKFIRKKIISKKELMVPLSTKEMMHMSYPGEKFYKLTRQYTTKLFSIANKFDKEYLMVDQLVPPSNTERYLRYFDNLKIIVVDRDPRDLYLIERIYKKDKVMPYDVNEFIKWFEVTRRHRKYECDDSERVMRLRFEDLIYGYDDTINKVIDFYGLNPSNHVNKKKHFNPDESRKNTRLWIKHNEYIEDIKRIEDKLGDFCYNIY